MPTTLNDYEVLETIGTGSYGICKKIKRKKDGKILVWKELDYASMTEVEKQLLVSEVNLLRELRHRHIVRYYDRIIDRGTSTLYIIMEFCESGDVGSLINKLKKEGKRIEEPVVWKICTQILLALQECHSRTKNGKVVLHRDLKPANVFLDSEMNVKLGDFGLARVLNHDTSFAKTYVGTPYYMSPEQMNHMSYNEKSDVWSLGCLLYELTALKPPFTATGLHELTSKINMGRFARIPFRYSDDLNRLICLLLQVDESRRPSVEDMLDHPVIKKEMKKMSCSSPTPDLAGSDANKTNHSSTHSSDEGYSSKVDSLKKKEQELRELEKALKEKESALKQKEKELDAREKSLQSREKIAEDRLLRAERLSKQFKQIETQLSGSEDTLKDSEKKLSTEPKEKPPTPDNSNSFRSSVDIPVPKSSILSSSKGRKSTDFEVPKKKVSFLHVNINDKENNIYNLKLPETFQSVERQLKMAEHTRQLYELHTQTRYATFGRTRSSVDLTHYDYSKGLTNRPWLGLR